MGLIVLREELLSSDVRRSGTSAVVKLVGELDTSTAAALYEQFAQLSRDGVSHVGLDLSELTFLDSTGISAIVAEHKRAGDLGGELIIFSPPNSIRRLFELTGLTEVLTIRPEHLRDP